jgi:hypothetical protein
MPRQIKIADAVQVSERAVSDIDYWLRSFEFTGYVKNVEDDPHYQSLDVDLLWLYKNREYKIEIKGDRWHKTGNFFFETLSNKEKNTPGCFLYTEADFIFYYFIETRALFLLPMPVTADWFRNNLERFSERETTTPFENGSFYTTVGRLVPIDSVTTEVPGVRRLMLQDRRS